MINYIFLWYSFCHEINSCVCISSSNVDAIISHDQFLIAILVSSNYLIYAHWGNSTCNRQRVCGWKEEVR